MATNLRPDQMKRFVQDHCEDFVNRRNSGVIRKNMTPISTLALGAEVRATDISQAAAAVATQNARRLGARVGFVVCDVTEAVAASSMDLIVANPPYVPLPQREGLQREVRGWEPPIALFAGETGLDIYARIVADAPRVLKPGGWLAMELGFGTLDAVTRLVSGWADVQVEPDLAGIPRVIAARV